jgi:hypothetical protein
MDSTYAPPVIYGKLDLIHCLNGMKGNVDIFGRSTFVTGVYEWEWILGAFSAPQSPSGDVKFLGFVDEHGNLSQRTTETNGIHMSLLRKRRRREKALDVIVEFAIQEATPRWETFKATDGVPVEAEFEILDNVHIFR